MYIYYVVDNLKTKLSNENVLKDFPKTDLTEGGHTDNFEHFEMTNQNVNIRHTRSTNPVKCNFLDASISIY